MFMQRKNKKTFLGAAKESGDAAAYYIALMRKAPEAFELGGSAGFLKGKKREL